MSPGPYSIGSDQWPGLSKLAEEAGEVLQRVGKIMGCNGREVHFEGSNNVVELEKELGDLHATLLYVQEAGAGWLSDERIMRRAAEKLRLFRRWHQEGREARVSEVQP